MQSFGIDDSEIKAHVRQSRVSPCVHVNPWFCEPIRHECRDNHLPLRFEPRLATGIVCDAATHIVQFCSVSSNEALLCMLSVFVKMSQAVPSGFCRR